MSRVHHVLISRSRLFLGFVLILISKYIFVTIYLGVLLLVPKRFFLSLVTASSWLLLSCTYSYVSSNLVTCLTQLGEKIYDTHLLHQCEIPPAAILQVRLNIFGSYCQVDWNDISTKSDHFVNVFGRGSRFSETLLFIKEASSSLAELVCGCVREQKRERERKVFYINSAYHLSI